jgi:hypothetical protein
VERGEQLAGVGFGERLGRARAGERELGDDHVVAC